MLCGQVIFIQSMHQEIKKCCFLVGNPGSPTTPPENLFIIKNLNLIPFLIM